MINAFIRSSLGTWGSAVLDFYIQNSLWINILILIYAAAVVIGRWNYRQFLNSLLGEFCLKQAELIARKNRADLKYALKHTVLPWEKAMQALRFPLLTPPGKYGFVLKNKVNLEKLFETEKLLDTLMK
jgi:hypothetical protein